MWSRWEIYEFCIFLPVGRGCVWWQGSVCDHWVNVVFHPLSCQRLENVTNIYTCKMCFNKMKTRNVSKGKVKPRKTHPNQKIDLNFFENGLFFFLSDNGFRSSKLKYMYKFVPKKQTTVLLSDFCLANLTPEVNISETITVSKRLNLLTFLPQRYFFSELKKSS